MAGDKKKNQEGVKKTTGNALPFDRTVTYPSYGGVGKVNTRVRQRGFDVAVTGFNGAKYPTRGSKPGYVTETWQGYESEFGKKWNKSNPELQRNGGYLVMKRGGVVGPKNVRASSAAHAYKMKTIERDQAIKATQKKKTNMAKAGRNTSGRRISQ